MPTMTISVVITCRDYLHYIGDALASVKSQIMPPNEVILVFDKTDPGSFANAGDKCIKVDCGDPFFARKAGFDAVTSDVVMFLDADDMISPNYISSGMAAKSEHNIVYSDMQYVGASDELVSYRPDVDISSIFSKNFMHVGCLVSTSDIIASGAFDQNPPALCQEDWVFWRKLVKFGCGCTKQRGIYYARKHDNNRSHMIKSLQYYDMKGIVCDCIGFIRKGMREPLVDVVSQWNSKNRVIISSKWCNIECTEYIVCDDVVRAAAIPGIDYLCVYDRYIDVESALRHISYDDVDPKTGIITLNPIKPRSYLELQCLKEMI